jgi:hypothetical protein
MIETLPEKFDFRSNLINLIFKNNLVILLCNKI